MIPKIQGQHIIHFAGAGEASNVRSFVGKQFVKFGYCPAVIAFKILSHQELCWGAWAPVTSAPARRSI